MRARFTTLSHAPTVVVGFGRRLWHAAVGAGTPQSELGPARQDFLTRFTSVALAECIRGDLRLDITLSSHA